VTGLVALFVLGQVATAPTLALQGRDPIELARGVDVRGFPSFHATYGAFRYHFVTEANRRKFAADPEAHGLQIGGACGSMGPLSGRGQGAIFSVVDGKIWQFASLQCQSTFLKNPPGYLEEDEGPSHSTDSEKRRGAAILDQAIAAHGGPARFKNLQRLVTVQKIEAASGKEDEGYYNVFGFDRNAGYLHRQHGVGWSYTSLVHGSKGIQFGNKFSMPLVESERRYLQRQVVRHPIVLMALRSQPGFEVSAAAREPGDDPNVDSVDIHYLGAVHVLHFDRKTHRLIRWHGRRRAAGPNRWVTQTYSNWTTVAGIRVPRTVTSEWEGQQGGPTKVTYQAIRINDRGDAAMFRFPTGR